MFISSPSKSALYGGVLKILFNTPVIGVHSTQLTQKDSNGKLQFYVNITQGMKERQLLTGVRH
jgi:hypothetical protein